MRSLLDSLFVFAGILELDGTLIEANRPALEGAGLELADVRGKKLWDCYWWSYAEDVRGQIRDACARAARGEVVRYEVPVRMAGDTRMPIAFQLAPRYDDTGRITHLIPSAVDIRQRRRVEEQLRESEALFREMSNGLPLIVWVHDAAGGQEMVNDTFCEFFGVTREEMTGARWQMLMHPDDAEAYSSAFLACVRDRRPFHGEVRVRRADGQWRWIESWARPRFTAAGELRGFVGTSADVTDRKRAEHALERSEERFRKIFENAATGIAITDWEGRFLQCNAAYAALLGYTEEELHRVDFASLIHPDDREVSLASSDRLRNGELPSFEIENRYVRKDGEPIWVRRFVSVLHGDTDEAGHLVTLVTDISSRRAAEQALRESEARLRLAAEATGFGTYDFDVATQRAAWSEPLRQMIGVQVEGPIDAVAELSPRIHPADRERFFGVARRILAPAETDEHEIEFRIVRGDGETRWLRDKGRVLCTETGGVRRPVRAVGTVLDITERKRAEEELRRAHGLIEGITQGTEDMIAAADGAFCYIYFNDAYQREFKKLWRQDIEVGTNMLEALAPWPEEQRKARELWSRALEGESFRVEMEFGPSTPETHVYDLRFNQIRDAQGGVVGAAHILRDVTEQVRVRQALRESEERLLESDRRKDEYLAMLGHELRNPLAAVRSATELVKLTKADDPRLHRASEVLERQSAHMVRLIDELLEVSRIARGKIAIDHMTLDVRDVFAEVLEDRSVQIAARGLELREEVASEPLWVLGDHVRLTQIFDNLVGNALKFTRPPGCITVLLEKADGCAVVCVRDTGAGIRAGMLLDIFEPFHQEKQDIARGSGGLGLGLALAKGLVELHQGTIEARSPGLGSGAEFVVRLPLTSAPASARPAQRVTGSPARRILIVEDNADAAQMLRDLLELQGHALVLAESGGEALGTLRDHRMDIVFCDIGLPGMSGYDFARAVRADSSLRDIALVALTGYGQPEDRKRTIEAGFDAHLTKPVDLLAVGEVLARLTEAAAGEGG